MSRTTKSMTRSAKVKAIMANNRKRPSYANSIPPVTALLKRVFNPRKGGNMVFRYDKKINSLFVTTALSDTQNFQEWSITDVETLADILFELHTDMALTALNSKSVIGKPNWLTKLLMLRSPKH